MQKPLAIDLFCGLLQAKLDRRADAPVNQLVTRRAENPEHVSLGVARECPRAVPTEFRLVRDLQDARLTARLARGRNVRIPATHPVELGVPVWTPRIVGPLSGGISTRPNAPKLPRGLTGAVLGAIPAIGAGRHDLEVRSAAGAVLPPSRHVGLFSPPPASRAPRAGRRAIELVRPYGDEVCGAFATGQFVHGEAVP